MIVGPVFDLTEDEISVAGMYMLTAIGFALLWKLIQPLNKYRIGVFILCIVGMVLTITLFWNMFMHAEVSTRAGWIAVGLAFTVMLLSWGVNVAVDRTERKE